MSIRVTLRGLERALRPAGLTARWLAVLRDVERITGGLDPDHAPASEETLLQQARQAAATGRDPGDVLADILASGVDARQ